MYLRGPYSKAWLVHYTEKNAIEQNFENVNKLSNHLEIFGDLPKKHISRQHLLAHTKKWQYHNNTSMSWAYEKMAIWKNYLYQSWWEYQETNLHFFNDK